MVEVIKALMWIVILYSFYSILGKMFCKVFRINCHVLIFSVVGFVICMVLFGLIEVPMHLLQKKLSVLMYAYLFCLTMMVGALSYKYFKVKKEPCGSTVEKIEIVVLGCIIGAQIVFQFCNMFYGSAADTGQYIGQISTALYTNTIRKYDPFTGLELKNFDWQNLFAAYEMHSAVLCKLFYIHPLVYIHRIASVIELIFINVILYATLLLLTENRRKSLIALFFVAIINYNTYSLYTWSSFMFLRTAESKSVLAVVILPLIFYWIVYFIKKEVGKKGWVIMFMTVISGVLLSKSGSFIIPVALTVEMIPIALIFKKRNMLLLYSICLIPCFIVLGYQLAIRG